MTTFWIVFGLFSAMGIGLLLLRACRWAVPNGGSFLHVVAFVFPFFAILAIALPNLRPMELASFFGEGISELNVESPLLKVQAILKSDVREIATRPQVVLLSEVATVQVSQGGREPVPTSKFGNGIWPQTEVTVVELSQAGLAQLENAQKTPSLFYELGFLGIAGSHVAFSLDGRVVAYVSAMDLNYLARTEFIDVNRPSLGWKTLTRGVSIRESQLGRLIAAGDASGLKLLPRVKEPLTTNQSALDALERMERTGETSLLLVAESGSVSGVVRFEQIAMKLLATLSRR